MRGSYFPFHALNLRSNPFRALTDDEWADIVVLPPALAAADLTGRHLQVLGELGRGKTSALLGLAARHRLAGRRVAYEYLPEGQRRFHTPLTSLQVFALDEAQRLTPRERARLWRAAQSGLRLLLGSHEDLSPAFAAHHLSFDTVTLDPPDAAHLARLLIRRVQYFTLDPSRPAVTLAPDAVAALHTRFGSNRRAIERCLYEVFQQLEVIGEITAAQVEAAAARLL